MTFSAKNRKHEFCLLIYMANSVFVTENGFQKKKSLKSSALFVSLKITTSRACIPRTEYIFGHFLRSVNTNHFKNVVM